MKVSPLPRFPCISSLVSVLAALCVAAPLLKAADGRTAKSLGAPAELRTEYLENPLGLDVAQPRLSWKLAPTREGAAGSRQTAYQILAASTLKALAANQGDLWDSGEVKSDASINVVYAGKELPSSGTCFWKVRLADGEGAWSAWSKPASFRMGLLKSQDWTAQWVGMEQSFEKGKGYPPPDNTVPDPFFRKSFLLPNKPSDAVLYVASVGYQEVYVNGNKVSDNVLMPSATDNRHRARYVSYDITRHLKKGTNTIGVWLGLSWSIFPQYRTPDKPGSPIMMAQAEISFPSSQKVRITTDSTWRTHPSPNTLLGVWDFMHFGGELYDFNKELPGWNQPDFDDTKWLPVKIYAPKLVVSADKTYPNKLVKELRPVGIAAGTNGVWRIDMGANYAGFFEMQLAGKAGDRIEFEFSERAEEAMTHRLHSACILGPNGKGTFRNRFNYGVGRWVTVKGLRNRPSENQIRGWLVRPAYTRTGNFSCDDELLNSIYQTTFWTFENLSLGNYMVDCPQRERMGYGGDAHATTRPGLNTYDLGAFYTKWIEDWRDTQGPDGNLPYTAPTYWGGGGPGWSGYCITLPWEMYRRYGDVRILEQNLPMMERWLAFLETKASNDLLARWGGEWDFLGDWLWPGAQGVNGDTKETLFFNNCYWVYNLQTAARISEVLGQPELRDRYDRRAAAVRKAIHEKFYNGSDSSYVNGFPAYLAIALLTEVPPAALRDAVWKRLEQEILVNRKGHIHAGITGGAFLFTTLMESNRQDLVYSMVRQKDYPGWGDMLGRGATTFYEDWECKLSYLHSSYLYVGSWFYEGLAGIRHPSAGFKQFDIEPCLTLDAGPNRVDASYESPYGMIRSAWEKKDGGVSLRVTVPPNTKATLRLRGVDAQTVKASKGSPQPETRNGSVNIALEPGNHTFSAALKR